MIVSREAATVLLKSIQGDAKNKITDGGCKPHVKISNDNDAVILVIKVYCVDEKQTKITDFSGE